MICRRSILDVLNVSRLAFDPVANNVEVKGTEAASARCVDHVRLVEVGKKVRAGNVLQVIVTPPQQANTSSADPSDMSRHHSGALRGQGIPQSRDSDPLSLSASDIILVRCIRPGSPLSGAASPWSIFASTLGASCQRAPPELYDDQRIASTSGEEVRMRRLQFGRGSCKPRTKEGYVATTACRSLQVE